MSDWRDDPSLVRQEDDAVDEVAELDRRWSRIFDDIIPAVVGGGATAGMVGQVVRIMTWQARKFVARHPDVARERVVIALRMVITSLEVEPGEVYDDLQQGHREPAG